MGTSCEGYVLGQDQMGKTIQFNYRGGAKYGTMIGGTVSMLIRIFIWFLTVVEIWHCFAVPGYTEELQFNQLHTPNSESYDILLSEGLPAFYIQTENSDRTDRTYNDETYFSYSFTLSNKEVNQTVAALPCDDIVPKYISDPYTRAQIIEEFAN